MKTLDEMRAYQRAHYHANKERWRQKRMRWEAKMRALVLAAKDKPCADCGGRWHPLVMEFDHLPGTKKAANLGGAVFRKWGLEKPWWRSPSATWFARPVIASAPSGV